MVKPNIKHYTFLRLLSLVSFLLINLMVNGQKSSGEKHTSGTTIKIGLLIQDKNSIEARQAAEMAIQTANLNPALKGQKFELIVSSLEGPWGVGSKAAVDMIFKDEVWAILGSHDGRNAHPVEQVTAKTQTIFLSAWATDPSLANAYVPWFFSVVPNDFQQSEALIEEIYKKEHFSRIAIAFDNDYDSKITLQSFLTQNKSAGKPEPQQFQYDNSLPDIKELVSSLNETKFDAIILLGQAKTSLNLIKKIRTEKNAIPVFCSISASSGNEDWIGEMNKSGNVNVISPLEHLDTKGDLFIREFKQKYGHSPDAVASYAYDGMNILIEGIIKSGYNKEKLREALSKLKFEGVTGLIQFDQRGNRIGLPVLSNLNVIVNVNRK